MTSPTSEPDSLAAAIIELREKSSQAKMAKQIGTTERTVKRWERGALPLPKWRPALIRLGIDERLFERSGDRDQIESRLRQLEAEIARIRRLLG